MMMMNWLGQINAVPYVNYRVHMRERFLQPPPQAIEISGLMR